MAMILEICVSKLASATLSLGSRTGSMTHKPSVMFTGGQRSMVKRFRGGIHPPSKEGYYVQSFGFGLITYKYRSRPSAS